MSTSRGIRAAEEPWPRYWRMVVIGLSMLVLCSCRGPHSLGPIVPGPDGSPPALPFIGPGSPVAYESSQPMTDGGAPIGPWSPPGIALPWPEDEYLTDGGDQPPRVKVEDNWEVRGLNLEDTVAHYDTLAGHRVVEPSNRVHIYSPRFGAVRQVVSLVQNQQMNPAVALHQPVAIAGDRDVQSVGTSKQNLQTEQQISRRLASIYRSEQQDGAVSAGTGAFSYHNSFEPYEDMAIIRQGLVRGTEMAWLAEGTEAAIVWERQESVQVILDHQKATEHVTDEKVMSVFTVKAPPSNPKLRIAKVASTGTALPGETVDFTLRFDNVGNELIGNVTILDNLTTRLEYVEGSTQCSLPAEFFSEVNEGDSLVLRWEISDPLEPGEGGIIRFQCRVR